MNQDEDTTIQKLTPGIWHGRVIRHEHNEVPGPVSYTHLTLPTTSFV